MINRRFIDTRSAPEVAPGAENLDLSCADRSGERLQVQVLYTTHSETLAALEVASRLGGNLDTHPKVVRLYAVPYTLPLERPAVSADFL